MESIKSKPKAGRPQRARNNGHATAREQDSSSSSATSSEASSSSEEETPARLSVDSSSSAESTSSEASSSASESMPPPRLPPVSTPPSSVIPNASAGASASGSQQDEEIETRPSRSESTASRANRLSLTLPIAPPTSFPSRPTPASSSVASFPATPIDVASGLASPAEPLDLITAIAAQERRVLELREELNRAESGLTKLKRQWATHEAQKKRAEIRRTEPMRSLPARPGTASTIDPGSPAVPFDDASSKRTSELDRRKALFLGQQPGSQAGSDPNTPTQSRRRVFRGGHARTLSLLSPTKTSADGFDVHEDQPEAEGEEEAAKSPMSPLELDSPFFQNLSRSAASQLSKRASWAPQSVHQVAGLKQVAGDLTATLWTFVEDLRQATVGEELAGANSSMRNIDPNSRTTDDSQSTIRASASSRPNLSRAFTTDLQGTPTPPPRHGASGNISEQPTDSKDKNTKSAASGSTKTRASKAGSKSGSKAGSKAGHGKDAKQFSWTPLTVDSYDDNDWSSWDSPTVKSPRWSGSTANGEAVASSLPGQADEKATPQKRTSTTSTFSPTSPSGSRANDINWPAALNRLTPGNIKRTATDLMKEWEKSLSPPTDDTQGKNTPIVEDRIL
ncbi:hypothetical protein HMPREF1624_00054 [Sporothrix schenckii ATCC 58251]|uniref:DUF4048 domain-containing protein n=1 Tax=Sporothrix schenckii (strain ATCC 58251 / de Perez 2211183) TaxID=1391915 RepID=U7Q3Z6_SPOS1|nr:hypothetical protein HMPREF1624_00054 [Sporothrix schenckii ATCC 58251]